MRIRATSFYVGNVSAVDTGQINCKRELLPKMLGIEPGPPAQQVRALSITPMPLRLFIVMDKSGVSFPLSVSVLARKMQFDSIFHPNEGRNVVETCSLHKNDDHHTFNVSGHWLRQRFSSFSVLPRKWFFCASKNFFIRFYCRNFWPFVEKTRCLSRRREKISSTENSWKWKKPAMREVRSDHFNEVSRILDWFEARAAGHQSWVIGQRRLVFWRETNLFGLENKTAYFINTDHCGISGLVVS